MRALLIPLILTICCGPTFAETIPSTMLYRIPYLQCNTGAHDRASLDAACLACQDHWGVTTNRGWTNYGACFVHGAWTSHYNTPRVCPANQGWTLVGVDCAPPGLPRGDGLQPGWGLCGTPRWRLLFELGPSCSVRPWHYRSWQQSCLCLPPLRSCRNNAAIIIIRQQS